MISTPWGHAQTQRELIPGVIIVSTASHGGIRVAPTVAQARLSPAGIAEAQLWGGNYWYEEDCAVAIIVHEMLDVREACGWDYSTTGRILERYFQDYLARRAKEGQS